MALRPLLQDPKDHPFPKEKIWYPWLKKNNKLWDFEISFRTSAFGKSNSYLSDKLLFINVEPALLEDSSFQQGYTKAHLEIMNIHPANLVFQISQKTIVEDYARFKAIHSHYKNQNYKTAVSKAGDSHISLQGVSETNPDYVKIDKKMIRRIDADKHKQTVVKSFVSISKKNNFRVIATGVETKAELQTLLDLGADYGQGDYFCALKPSLPECCVNVQYCITEAAAEMRKSDIFSYDRQSLNH